MTGGVNINRSGGLGSGSSRPTGGYFDAKLIYRVGQIVAEEGDNLQLTEESVVQRLVSKYQEYRRKQKVSTGFVLHKAGEVIVVVMRGFGHGISFI